MKRKDKLTCFLFCYFPKILGLFILTYILCKIKNIDDLSCQFLVLVLILILYFIFILCYLKVFRSNTLIKILRIKNYDFLCTIRGKVHINPNKINAFEKYKINYIIRNDLAKILNDSKERSIIICHPLLDERTIYCMNKHNKKGIHLKPENFKFEFSYFFNLIYEILGRFLLIILDPSSKKIFRALIKHKKISNIFFIKLIRVCKKESTS